MPTPEMVRRGEYAARGDYHRTPDPSWDYYPTYIAKLDAVRRYLNALPAASRVLDAGCGEGVLVDEYAGRLDITGVDANYSSARVAHGSVMALPFPDASFDRALCLDVLEHLAYEDQPRALADLFRVLRSGGELLVSVPNLAHLQSRIHFLLRGRLIRTASEYKHPGRSPRGRVPSARPARGVHARRTPRHLPDRPGPDPPRAAPSAGARRSMRMTRLLPVPGWCFLNLLT